MGGVWTELESEITERLDGDDDRALWEAALCSIHADAESLLSDVAPTARIVTEVGRCSHWLRPHQTRWTADGGFAWPTGYGGRNYSRSGLPQFDWSCLASWDPVKREWKSEPNVRSRSARSLRFRVAIPSRTAQHPQAAIHTVWMPGPPQHRRAQLIQFYGFRRSEAAWTQTAYYPRPDGRAYERANRAR